MKKLALAALLLAPLLALAQPANPSSWAVVHTPAAAAAATIARGPVANQRHVATSVTVCLNAVAAQTTPVQFVLRQGATGAGTIVWTVKLTATAGTTQCHHAPLAIRGPNNTAMTLESTAAPAATNFVTVSLVGYDEYSL